MPPSSHQRHRRLGIDRLRLGVCLVVIAYHAIRVFDTNDLYHLKSATRLVEFDPLSRFLRAWMMEYFFLIGGMMAAAALESRRTRDYIRQRVWRLFVPFIAGVIVLGPLIKYAEVLNHRRLTSRGVVALDTPLEFTEVVGKFFTRISWVTWGHLWFLAYLFLLTIVLIPLFRMIARSSFDASRYAYLLIGALLLAALAIEAELRPLFPFHHNLITDWANIAMYALLMLAGAALVRWPQLEDAVRTLAPAFALLTALGIWLYAMAPDTGEPVARSARALITIGMLGLLIFLEPLLTRRPAGATPLLQSALAVYVLHFVPLLAVALLIADLPIPVWQRIAIIILATGAVTFALLRWLVWPFAPARRFFGIGAPRLRGDVPP